MLRIWLEGSWVFRLFEVGVGLELELSDNLIGGVGGVKLGLS